MVDQSKLEVSTIPGIPEVSQGDCLSELILTALKQNDQSLANGDILVIAHKVVSKAEGRTQDLREIDPDSRAAELAEATGKDPRKVQVILNESQSVIRAHRHPSQDQGVIICQHRLGFVSANAGVDESNIVGEDQVLLLPEDPDASARRIRDELKQATGLNLGIIVSDTFGRPWRLGLVNVAIGIAGVPATLDWTEESDAYGKPLRVTKPAFADEIAAASGLLMVKNASTPVILFRGLSWNNTQDSIENLLRPPNEDLFL